jgi:hypothetical protein
MDSHEPELEEQQIPSTDATDALRIQVAAVAAQQIALDEKEIRLADFEADLDRQGKDERTRRAAALAGRERRIEDQENDLRQRRLRFTGDVELSRRRLQESWAKLRQAQFRWKHRCGLERAALRVRAHDVETAAQQIALARQQLVRDQHNWQTQRLALEAELDGVNTRVQNQRQLLSQQEARLQELQAQVLLKEQQLTPVPNDSAASSVAPDATVAPVDAKTHDGAEPTQPVAEDPRVVDLDRLAEDLADQRCQVAEAWQRVAALHDQWHADRTQVAAELEAYGQRLLERDLIVIEREGAGVQAEETLRQRHGELDRLHDQLIAWQAQLRADENAWESDKARLEAELGSREALAEQQRAALAELRQRWVKRRKHEVDRLLRDRAALQNFRKETTELRRQLIQRMSLLEDDQRVFLEKSLALEYYRHDVLARGAEDPQAEERLERLRRRWLAQNADALRSARREREAQRAELQELDRRHETWQRRASAVAAAEADLQAKQTAWEQAQLESETHLARLECDLQRAQEQRAAAQQQMAALREEVERVARALLDQPDPPRFMMERAA